MGYSFILKQSTQSLMGKEEKQGHFSLIFKSASASQVLTPSPSIHPYSGATGREEWWGVCVWVGRRVRELLGRRSSWVLKNEIQRVKRNCLAVLILPVLSLRLPTLVG